jgi:hypothetical protein
VYHPVSPAAAATLPANILQSPYHYFQQQQQLHHQQPQQQQHHCSSNGRRMLATMSTLMLPTMTATLSAANNGPPMTVAAPPTHVHQQPPKQALQQQSVDKLVMTAVNHNSAICIANKMGIYSHSKFLSLCILFWLDDAAMLFAARLRRKVGGAMYVYTHVTLPAYDNAAFCVWGKLKVRVCIVGNGWCLCAEKVLLLPCRLICRSPQP